jgi:Protein of unknown function (Hypoth_ymh)
VSILQLRHPIAKPDRHHVYKGFRDWDSGKEARTMELKREISRQLYQAIREKYERGWYRDAILAAIACLEDCIREKANFERAQVLYNPEGCFDQAFGNLNPLIQINDRTTAAHLYEQQGFAQIVLGIHQGIRTPRIHGELCDDEKSTNAMIVFIDYLMQRVQSANP